MADRCLRCGNTMDVSQVNHCRGEFADATAQEKLACRDRQIMNQQALLRGVIRKLERIQEMIGDIVEVLS